MCRHTAAGDYVACRRGTVSSYPRRPLASHWLTPATETSRLTAVNSLSLFLSSHLSRFSSFPLFLPQFWRVLVSSGSVCPLHSIQVVGGFQDSPTLLILSNTPLQLLSLVLSHVNFILVNRALSHFLYSLPPMIHDH